MAKIQIIWSRTAIKKLYAILESEIRKGNTRSFSKNIFKAILKQIRILVNQPNLGLTTSDDSVLGLITGSYIIFYEISEGRIVIHTISILPLNSNK
jgi:plasmid stabilization system protein ParE